jgi:CHAT domain-containing protein/tetratricopeptide (TPR) repeat protein
LLSFGAEIDAADSPADWTVKIDSLNKASQLFQQFGMQEMRLWANYLTAHLVQFHLHDHSLVYDMTREILNNLKGVRLPRIELATLQLQSLALIGLRNTGSLAVPADGVDPLQIVLSQTAELAKTMGFDFEQARAIYASGVEYAKQSLYSNALEQFQRAVEITDSVGSAELATSIRESIVQIHTIQGDAPATSEILQEIESQLVEDGGGDELALNLLAQARLLMSNYHYGEAFETLATAFINENNSAIRTQINFEAAKILFETGRLDESISYLQLAGITPDSVKKGRGNALIDVGEGLRIMANIHRVKGEYARMQETRKAQGQYQPQADLYLYDQGLDAIARARGARQQAMSYLKQSYTSATTAGHVDLQHLSRLQYCALAGSEDGFCSKAVLNDAYEWLLGAGIPRYGAEAMFLWAQIKVLDGQRSAALSVLDRLVDEIHFLRYSLRGVLGAWYWERREMVFKTWLELLVNDENQRGRADASASLLALSKIRTTESYTGSELNVNDRSAATDLLRDQLAQRASPGAGQAVFALNTRIDAGLDKLRGGFRRDFEYLSSAGLEKTLGNFANDEVVLTYHISPSLAQVWVGYKGKVQRRNISNPAELYQTLQTTRGGLEGIETVAFNSKMDELGGRLITPVADLLKEKVYWIPTGPLLGFPVDALRIKGRYLAERYRVANLLSFPLNTNPARGLQTGSLEKVFLAGNPRDYSGDYASRLETSAEIRTVADFFIGPGLEIVQGVALLPDEFQREGFLQSNLIHLSMPGVINLKYPGDSGLELSESEYGPGRVRLRPLDIRTQKLVAGLVFLSSITLGEKPLSDFTSQTGLVSDFMAAGAGSVIANVWSGDAASNETFIADFYRKLLVSKNIAESLHESKLHYLKNSHEKDPQNWAGYQLYLK